MACPSSRFDIDYEKLRGAAAISDFEGIPAIGPKDNIQDFKEALNKSLHALAGTFSVMLCQMPLDVAMLRLRAIFLA